MLETKRKLGLCRHVASNVSGATNIQPIITSESAMTVVVKCWGEGDMVEGLCKGRFGLPAKASKGCHG